MKKIVIHGCTGLKNSGDEAILQVIVQQYGKEYDITAISRNVSYTEKMHPGIRVIPDERDRCMEAIEECDLFLLGGGGLLQDETTIFNVSVWLKYLKYARRLGKRICVYANSIGPLKWKRNRYLVKKYLGDVDLITLRDKDSALLLKEIGITENVYITADPVFSLEWEEEEPKKEEYVCMALRHWFDIIPFIPVRICSKLHIRSIRNRKRYNKYIDTMAETAKYINNELGYKIIFVSFLNGRDDRVAQDILSKINGLPGNLNELITGEYLTPDKIINVIAHARFLIGMRLHSIIYAICTKTPMVIIDYSSKVRGMAEINRLSEYSVDINRMDAGSLMDRMNKMLASEKEYRKILQEQYRIMREKEKENKRLVDGLMKKENR